MRIANIEAHVLKALKAYKIEKKLKPGAAEVWAIAHLDEAVARVASVVDASTANPEIAIGKAFADLKTWAQSTN